MNDNYNEFVPNVHFELIPIKDLVSNQEYQRSLSMTHVKKAVENLLITLLISNDKKVFPLIFLVYMYGFYEYTRIFTTIFFKVPTMVIHKYQLFILFHNNYQHMFIVLIIYLIFRFYD